MLIVYRSLRIFIGYVELSSNTCRIGKNSWANNAPMIFHVDITQLIYGILRTYMWFCHLWFIPVFTCCKLDFISNLSLYTSAPSFGVPPSGAKRTANTCVWYVVYNIWIRPPRPIKDKPIPCPYLIQGWEANIFRAWYGSQGYHHPCPTEHGMVRPPVLLQAKTGGEFRGNPEARWMGTIACSGWVRQWPASLNQIF